jgi:hypothetical protein
MSRRTTSRIAGPVLEDHDGLMRPVALFWPYSDAQRRHLLRTVDE